MRMMLTRDGQRRLLGFREKKTFFLGCRDSFVRISGNPQCKYIGVILAGGLTSTVHRGILMVRTICSYQHCDLR